MPDSVTIARPYAKAIFEHALEENCLSAWSNYLQLLAEATENAEVSAFISNPESAKEQHSELLLSLTATIAKEDTEALTKYIEMLAENGRLLLLPEIFLVFNQMRAEQEKKLEVSVSSYSKLSKEQQQALADALSKRFKREVTLNVIVDKTSLIGGAVIRAGDLVIDGSIRGKLEKLRASLIA